MLSLATTKRAIRTSTTLLRSAKFTPALSHGKRVFHESANAKAVEAVAPGLTQTAPPPFAQPGFAASAANVPGGQLNIRDHLHKPGFYEAVSEILKLREKYIAERCIFVEAKDMIRLCLGLGAREEDLLHIQDVSNHLYGDPTLPFRKSRNGRFCMDFETKSLRRLEFQPFLLSADEDFKRHDSGQIRRFDEVENELQLNSVLQALFVFKAIIINGIDIAARPKLEYDSNKWVCTLFNVRTITSPDILGEPALEGVHSDGVDHTMTTFLGSKNMTDNSAVTYMHSMKEKTGIPLEEISPLNLLARVQHRHLLDTLLLVDHERKHSLSAVYPVDESQEANRDMLIFFTRRPVDMSHSSGSIDSLNAHKGLPMEVPLFVPNRD